MIVSHSVIFVALLESGAVKRLELVFISATNEKIIENWSLDISPENGSSGNDSQGFEQHVAALLRQIQNSVAFLPVISHEMCKFDIRVHCDKETETAPGWEGAGLGLVPFTYLTDQFRGLNIAVSSRLGSCN